MRFFIACLRRALFSKKYAIHLVTTFLLSLLSVKLLKAINQTTNLMPKEVFDTFKTGNTYNIGVLTVSKLDILDNHYYDEIITGVLSGSFLLCIIATFISLFVCSEFKNGYIKVAITHGQKRSSMFNQYLILSVVLSLPISAISIIGVSVSLSINKMVSYENHSHIIQILVFQTFLIIICSICFLCVSMMLEKYKSVAVCVSSVFVIPLLPGYIRILTKGKINIESYSLFSILIHSQNYNNTEILKGVIIAIITALLLYLMGLNFFQKRNYE